ncbi:DUF6794 domain-containing protein [Desertivirga brevis]|uniref:DUF6794 domain-containing protein n=1 Tax=Desertivirga brevis TaxID=2810310 RepID=UPI001A96D5E9|nr:DUF6794 domain-containing protein [Pedobacter sp. SYSU D00873]
MQEPESLKEAVNYLTIMVSPEDQIEFMEMSELDFTSNAHFTLGKHLRSQWRLWTDSTGLGKWFTSVGIMDADDRSDFVLTCFYKKITATPLNIDELLKRYL